MENILPWAALIVPSLITIVGLRISYVQNKKNIANEIMKSKRIMMAEKGIKVFEMVILLIDSKQSKKLNQDFFNKTLNDIYVYGSKEAISIFAEFQQYNYKTEEKKKLLNKYQPFAYLCLLLSQLKYDVTGEVINPMEILRIRINDYETNSELKDNLPLIINELIDKYKLNENFKVTM